MTSIIHVCGKDEASLRSIDNRLNKVVLERLPQSKPEWKRNALCETRFHLWAMDNFEEASPPERDYIGLFHASYATKFPHRPSLDKFIDVSIPTNAVFAVMPVLQQRNVAELFHPGMGELLDEVCVRNSFDYYGLGLMTNSFYCHRTAYWKFLQWFRSEFEYWDTRYGDDFPFSCVRTKPQCRPAYFYERVSCLWFSNSGYRITPVPPVEFREMVLV